MKFTTDRLQKLGEFLSRDGAMSAARVLIGVVLGGIIGSNIGIAGLVAFGAALVGLTGIAHHSIERQRQHELLDLYREEISTMLGKDPKNLTIKDLKQASRQASANVSPKGKALDLALDYFRNTRNFYILSQTATAGLMAAGLWVVNDSLFPGLPTAALAGAAGLLYNELFQSVSSIGAVFTDKNIKAPSPGKSKRSAKM